MWLWSVFTWHQGGHGVQKQYNGGCVGVPNPISSPEPLLPRYGMRNPVGVKLGVSYVNAFFCTDAGHESKNAVFLLFSRNTEPLVVENDSCQAKSGWQIVTASLQSRFHNTETFFRYFFPFDHSYYSDLPLKLLSWPITVLQWNNLLMF